MTGRHDDPDHVHHDDDAEFEAFLRGEGQLSSLLRGVPQPEVPEPVDALVRADARAALQEPAGAANDAAASPAVSGGMRRGAGRGARDYRVPLALAATVVLGVSLGVQWSGWQGEPAPWRIAEHPDTAAAPAPAAAPSPEPGPAIPVEAPPVSAAGVPAQVAVPAPKPVAPQAADVVLQANRAEAEQDKPQALAVTERAAAAKQRTQVESAHRDAAKLAAPAPAAAPAASVAPAPTAASAPAAPVRPRVAIPVPAPIPQPAPAPVPAVVAEATSTSLSRVEEAPRFAPAPPPPPPYLPPAAEAQVQAQQSSVMARSRPVQVTGRRSALPAPASDARAEQWLALVNELLDKHLDADARKAWHDFRIEYPAYRVPAELQARIDALPPTDEPR